MTERIGFKLLVLMIICNGNTICWAERLVTQYSTFNAFISGLYDGQWGYREIIRNGNFGLGAPDKVDGETIIMNNKVYEIKNDGNTSIVDLTKKTPFVFVVKFLPDIRLKLNVKMSKIQFEKWLNDSIKSTNQIYAIKIIGSFSKVKTRSNPPMVKPYKPLTEVIQSQKIFNTASASGIFVGFRFPIYLKGLNIPGYHFHFLPDNKHGGGHILDYTIKNISIEIMHIESIKINLPNTKSFNTINFIKELTPDLKTIV